MSRPARASLSHYRSGTPTLGAIHSNDTMIRDDISDVSSLSEMSLSMSYSVNAVGRGSIDGRTALPSAAELFATHANKIYLRENQRHWTRIRDRLQKVGITQLLSHISLDDTKEKEPNGSKGKVESEGFEILVNLSKSLIFYKKFNVNRVVFSIF